MNKTGLVPHGKIVIEVFEHPTDREGSVGEVTITGCRDCLIRCIADQMMGDREFATMMLEASRIAVLAGKIDPR